MGLAQAEHFHTLSLYIYNCLYSTVQLPGTSLASDLRIVPLGSGGAIMDLHWFLNYRDIKLVVDASEIEGSNDLLAYCKH
jgi:hypothetical protein